MPFVKGHGTENDFVLVPDREGLLDLTPDQVRALCDRRAGIGADGVIRVAPGTLAPFFMDYRNADGSLAEMCGNGARVFTRFLVDAGWTGPGPVTFETRAGLRTAEVGPDGDVTVGMGPAVLGAASAAVVGGVRYPGVAVDVGNPHLVCRLDGGLAELAALDLTRAPGVDAELFPAGVNVEFVVPLAPDRVRMRVHERGSGETRSCGTGTVAVATVALGWAGRSVGSVHVLVPGGAVRVDRTGQDSSLTGPAVLVATGHWTGT
nr:diaminopimelate epimerase [Nakamurella flavida]